MIVSTGSYLVNDTMTKLATAGLPLRSSVFVRLIVAISAVLVVLIGAGVAHLVSERWVTPEMHHLLLMTGAGLFLIFGHFIIFMAYRMAPPVRGAILLLLHRLDGHFGAAGVRAISRHTCRLGHPAGGRQRPRHCVAGKVTVT
jgi:drug/metabolite transporter (DMT)-like permease